MIWAVGVVGVAYTTYIKKWSAEKEHAFNMCWEHYCNGENSTAFGVGNANSYGFTASWLETKDNENVMRIETKRNSYLVWLDSRGV